MNGLLIFVGLALVALFILILRSGALGCSSRESGAVCRFARPPKERNSEEEADMDLAAQLALERVRQSGSKKLLAGPRMPIGWGAITSPNASGGSGSAASVTGAATSGGSSATASVAKVASTAAVVPSTDASDPGELQVGEITTEPVGSVEEIPTETVSDPAPAPEAEPEPVPIIVDAISDPVAEPVYNETISEQTPVPVLLENLTVSDPIEPENPSMSAQDDAVVEPLIEEVPPDFNFDIELIPDPHADPVIDLIGSDQTIDVGLISSASTDILRDPMPSFQQDVSTDILRVPPPETASSYEASRLNRRAAGGRETGMRWTFGSSPYAVAPAYLQRIWV